MTKEEESQLITYKKLVADLVEQFDVYEAGWLGEGVWRNRIGLQWTLKEAKKLLAENNNSPAP